MLRIMIVDDEALPRIALRNIIEKEHIFCGEAASGQEAYTLALKTRPDVILVDIIMPDFDGFELIGRLKEELPDTRYLIISNVENNATLKKAIKAHVSDYLIKGTVTAESLLEVLDNLENELTANDLSSGPGYLTENDSCSAKNYLPVLNGDITGREAIESICRSIGFPSGDTCYYCVRFTILKKSHTVSSRSIRFMIREILDDSGDGRTFSVSDSEIAVLISPPGDGNMSEAVRDFAERSINSVMDSFSSVISCGISDSVEGYSNIRKAFLEAGEALGRAYFTGPQSINTYCSIEKENPRKLALSLNTLVQNTLSRDSAGNTETLISLLSEIRKQAKVSALQKEFVLGLYYDVIYYAYSVVNKELSDISQTPSISHLSSCATLEELHHESVEILMQFGQMTTVPGNENTIVRQIKDYIDEHIQDQLSLEEIAEHIYMNPTYLSQLYKKKTGEKLRSYIVSERIRKAKRYLEEGKSIHETAVLTGFASDSYFIQCFKDNTLTTPREYVRNINMCDLGCR